MNHFLSFLAISTTLGAGALWADSHPDHVAPGADKALQKKMDLLHRQMSALQSEIDAMKPVLTKQEGTVSRVYNDVADMKKEHGAFIKKGSKDGTFVFPDSNTTLGINGYVKGDMVFSGREYKPNNPNANSLFYDAPLEGSDKWKKGSETHFLVRESRLNITTETPTSSAKVGSRLEVDFFGNAGSTETTPRIRHAVIHWAGAENKFWFGQTFTNFDDGRCASDADILDFFGIAGTPGGRSGQVGWKRTISSNVYTKLAVEFWGDKATQPSLATTSHHSRQPALVAQIGTENGPVFGSISGFVGRQVFIPTGTNKKRANIWGLSQSLAFEMTPQDRLSYDLTYGQGLPSWLSNDQGFAQDTGNGDKIYAQRGAGFGIAYAHKWNDLWRSNLGLGTFRIYNRSFMTSKAVTRWIRDLHVNTILSPVKSLDVGLEYAVGQRRAETVPNVSSEGTKRHSVVHRMQFSVKWKF